MLFPAVAAVTACHVLAAILIFGDESTCFPIFTKFVAIIFEDVWFSSEILPVVIVHALRLIMLLVERTTLSFEIEHKKVRIFLHLMNQPRFQLLGAMSKRAVISIFTFA